MNDELKLAKDFRDDILREQVRLAMKQLPTMQTASFIVALALCFMVRNIVPHINILIWILIIFAIVISRIMLYYRFIKVREEPFNGNYWKNNFLIMALISGIFWGLSAFIIYPFGNLGIIAFFLLAIASSVASVTVSHSSIRLGPSVWAAPVLLMYAIRCFMDGGEFGNIIGFLTVIYLLIIIRYSFNQNNTITSAISLKFENAGLLEELRKGRETLEKVVEERTIQIREEKEISDAIIESLPGVFYMFGADGKFFRWNKRMETVGGCSALEMASLHPTTFFHGEEKACIARQIQKVFDEGEAEAEAFLVTKSGEKIPYFFTGVHILVGKIPYLLGLGIDITKRKRSEEALRESEDKLAFSLEAADIGFWDLDLRNHTANRSLRHDQIFGYPELLPGWTYEMFLEHILPEDRAEVDRKFQEALRVHHELSFECRIRRVDGAVRWIWVKGRGQFNEQGAPVKMLGLVGDITERKQAEQERLRLDKMESLATLSGGIAHDFNNILTVIFANIDLAMLGDRIDPRVRERLSQAEKACLRAQTLSQQLLTFAKGGAPIKKIISIPELLRDTAGLTLSGSKVRCEFSISENLWPVEADEGQISQVFSNLLINADQAMPEGGIIGIRAENFLVEEKSAFPLPGGKYLKITFADQGVGIAPQYVDKIFDPYFSTKRKGSGLGLAAAHSIIENHSGYINVVSQVGVGSTFTIYLPAAGAKALVDERENLVESIKGQGRVLVMDDEEMVRELLGSMLDHLGYEADFAGDGAQALEKYVAAQEAGRPFVAVILDLTIPGGLGGIETIKKLIEIDPQVKAIVSSGYSDDPIMANFENYGFRGVLAKPYKVVELSKILQGIIAMKSD